MAEPEVYSSKWWLRALVQRLVKRAPELRKLERYYDGEHKMVFASSKFQDAFGGLFGHFADNWCAVVVDAVEERLRVEGFRFGDKPEADKAAWDIWQRSNLDADAPMLHTDMLGTGYGYGLAWYDADGKGVITVESPHECIVGHAAGSRRERAAGLKLWRAEDGYLYACLYMPDELYKFVSSSKSQELSPDASESVQWKPWQPKSDDTWPLENPAGRVNLVPFYNRPRTTKAGRGQSELSNGILRLQDAVNKLCIDLLVASEFGSYRQRYAAGYEPQRDDDGNPINPFRNIAGGVWAVGPGEGGREVRFGEFGETNLGNIVKGVETMVQHLASQSRTPPHYLNAQADRLSGESIKAAETGLVAKVRKTFRPTGEGWEELERLAFAYEGDSERAARTDAEVIWGDPESRTESEHVDALVKLKDIGVPQEQLQEDAGYSPQQRARFKAMKAAEALEGALFGPPQPPPGAPGPPAPPAPPEQ